MVQPGSSKKQCPQSMQRLQTSWGEVQCDERRRICPFHAVSGDSRASHEMLLPQYEYVVPSFAPLAMVVLTEPSGQRTWPLLQLKGNDLRKIKAGGEEGGTIGAASVPGE